MTHLDTNIIKKIALLARLEVKDHEIAGYQKDLTSIFDMVEKIQNVDTGSVVADTASSILKEPIQRTRHDVATAIVSSTQQKELQKIAPNTEQGLYLVPQVMNE